MKSNMRRVGNRTPGDLKGPVNVTGANISDLIKRSLSEPKRRTPQALAYTVLVCTIIRRISRLRLL